eukprot:1129532-Amphidinium_carterae.1
MSLGILHADRSGMGPVIQLCSLETLDFMQRIKFRSCQASIEAETCHVASFPTSLLIVSSHMWQSKNARHSCLEFQVMSV